MHLIREGYKQNKFEKISHIQQNLEKTQIHFQKPKISV